ncbi:MAG TPA: thioredoxin [Candidatus Polarisedimenticolaceae bacterium]|nr:thioredoxin [Candidatus Polarisedimenticolaceae bacterium]
MAGNGILTLTDDNFDDQIKKVSGPVLVDFWAAWCGPCKMIAPSLEQLAGEMAGRATVAKVNVDENGDVANRFGIRSIPTLMIFKEGRVVDQIVGALPKEQIRRMVEKHLA